MLFFQETSSKRRGSHIRVINGPFSLGWIAQQFSIAVGFFLLALLYSAATVTASRARQLLVIRS